MCPESRNIEVTKTARFWVEGDISGGAHTVVFVLHGYGMAALDCLNLFDKLKAPGVLMVAPEGLSRFYRKGFAGDVVASWMTREDRDLEIRDQAGYLDKLLVHILDEIAPKASRVVVVGYSQGVATGSRWIRHRKGAGIDMFVSYAGEISPDVLASGWPAAVKVIQVFSDTDEFIPSSNFHSQASTLRNSGVDVGLLQYEGKHAVLPDVVERLMISLFL